MKNQQQTEKEGIKKASPAPRETGNDPSSDNTVFDWDGLLYRLMGDEEIAGEIVDDFLKQIPVNLDALKEALDKKDPITVKKEAHIIKGASGNVGAVVLQQIAEKIENAAGSDDLIKAGFYIREFDTHLEVFKEELVRRLRRP